MDRSLILEMPIIEQDNANNTSTVDNRRNRNTIIIVFRELEQITKNNIDNNSRYSLGLGGPDPIILVALRRITDDTN